jgi:hypothetical protein
MQPRLDEEGDQSGETNEGAITEGDGIAAMAEERFFRIARLSFMMSSGFLSAPSAMAGKLSVMRLTQSKMDGDERSGQANRDGDEHADDFADVARDKEEDRLADVGVNATAFFHRFFNRGEVIVGENHVGRAFGDVGAGDAHRDADIGRFKDGASLTPSPVMAAIWPLALMALTI